MWKLVGGTNTSHAHATEWIEQTASTIAITPILDRTGVVHPIVYPIGGSEKKEKLGRQKITRSGHWHSRKLVLELTDTFRGRHTSRKQYRSQTMAAS
jgi:hypothetical protein